MNDRIIRIGSGVTVTPLLVLAVTSSAASRSVVHPIIGRAESDVTLGPLDSAVGSIQLLHEDAESAAACVALHSEPGVFILTCDTLPAWSRRYVVEGAVTSGLDPQTVTRWTVEIGYREVAG